jgi:hypothetical protein
MIVEGEKQDILKDIRRGNLKKEHGNTVAVAIKALKNAEEKSLRSAE